MNRSHFTPLAVFVGTISLLLATSFQSFGANFSGRVIDEAENPVAGLTVALPAFRLTTPQDADEPVFLPSQQSETNESGEFLISDITSPSVKLMLLPERHAAYEIRSAEIEGVPFYLDQRQHGFGGLTFAIAPGADVKDVEITVRPRMRIRGRILSADGTPLRNARVELMVHRRGLDGRGRGSGSGPRTLDAEGYFVRYLNAPAYYTVSVTYQGQSAKSEEVLLEDGQRHDELVLSLKGEPEPVKLEQAVARIREVERFEAAWKRSREGMWAVNPENRHAYKRIYCETREEAQDRAIAQGAHLVAINDEAEQAWLLEVFGRENFWIGLTVDSKEERQWDNGEPVTYANWHSPEETADSEKARQTGDASQNYTVLVASTGKWQVVRQGNPLVRLTERAILEKENLVIGAPERKGDIENARRIRASTPQNVE